MTCGFFQVQKVESEYQSLKRDYVSLRSEVDDEHKLRINAEETLQQLQQEAGWVGSHLHCLNLRLASFIKSERNFFQAIS